MILKGRVWKFGDNVHTSYFLSGKHGVLVRAGKYEELAQHILEDVDPSFIRRFQRGDVLVAGKAFGTGRSLSGQAGAFKTLGSGLIAAFQALGLGGVIAKSFSPEWERVAINAGLPAVVYDEIQAEVETGDLLELDLSAAEAANHTRNSTIKVRPSPEGIVAILDAGGLERYTIARLTGGIGRSGAS